MTLFALTVGIYLLVQIRMIVLEPVFAFLRRAAKLTVLDRVLADLLGSSKYDCYEVKCKSIPTSGGKEQTISHVSRQFHVVIVKCILPPQ